MFAGQNKRHFYLALAHLGQALRDWRHVQLSECLIEIFMELSLLLAKLSARDLNIEYADIRLSST